FPYLRLMQGFGRKVLQQTSRIPFGKVSTYREVAAGAGSPRGMRAAGNALGSNPIPIVVPCHRVVRTGGGLGGYTGGISRQVNLRANPSVEVVVDHYDEDWTALWWVRARGMARILGDGPERDLALRLLAAKYEQYRVDPPPGSVVAVQLTGVTTWEASPGNGT